MDLDVHGWRDGSADRQASKHILHGDAARFTRFYFVRSWVFGMSITRVYAHFQGRTSMPGPYVGRGWHQCQRMRHTATSSALAYTDVSSTHSPPRNCDKIKAIIWETVFSISRLGIKLISLGIVTLVQVCERMHANSIIV